MLKYNTTCDVVMGLEERVTQLELKVDAINSKVDALNAKIDYVYLSTKSLREWWSLAMKEREIQGYPPS